MLYLFASGISGEQVWCDDMGGSILNHLELMDGFMGDTKEKRVAVIEMGCKQSVDQDGSAGGSKGRTKAIGVV